MLGSRTQCSMRSRRSSTRRRRTSRHRPHQPSSRAISVAGFRGIGRQARLDLYPAPGLMVVSGRNGSGKSSFAEALELALTGTSYRWHKKEVLWTETWQNLHHSDPCAIRVGFTAEGTGPFTVGMDWAPGAALTERRSWTQAGSEKRVEGTDDLGWARPLELWRPILSYDELGRLFDGGPSALYDALAKLLGLEVLADAEKWLAAQLKSTKAARERADDERKRLLAVLADSADERAERATALLRKKGAALEDVLALATGSDDSGLQVASALRALTQLDTPTLDEIEAAAIRLRAAGQAVAATTGNLADSTRQRVDLLQAALRFHDHVGDSDCPVCGQGSLDSDWAARTRDAVASAEEALGEYRAATTELTQARSAATNLIARLDAVDEVAGVELPALAAYNQAVATAQQSPDDDTATGRPSGVGTDRGHRRRRHAARPSRRGPEAARKHLGAARSAARRLGAHGRRSSSARRHREDHDGGQEVDDRSRRGLPQPSAGTHRRAGAQDLGATASGEQRRPR